MGNSIFGDLKQKIAAKNYSISSNKVKSSLPKISHTSTSTVKLSKGIQEQGIDQCMIIIPDVHSYERDVKAYELAMESVRVLSASYNVTKVIQLGDLLECGEISSHPSSHVKEKSLSYVDELEWATTDFWGRIKEYSPDAELFAHLGNHEHRLNNWLLKNLGRSKITENAYDEMNPTSLYEGMGIKVIPYGNENVKDGTLEIFPNLVTLHGWSFSTNCARDVLMKLFSGSSAIFGHTHRIQSYCRRDNIKDQLVGAYNIGALAKPNMFYQKGIPSEHALAFAVVMTHKNGFNVITIPILGGENKYVMLPNGSVLSN